MFVCFEKYSWAILGAYPFGVVI